MKEDDPVGWATEASGGNMLSSDVEMPSSRPTSSHGILDQNSQNLPGAEFLAAWYAASEDNDMDEDAVLADQDDYL